MKNNLAGRQGSPRLDFENLAPLIQTPPATAREIRVPDSRANLSPAYCLPWVREDAEGLHRLFLRVEILREQGHSLNKALQRRWYGPRFHTAHRVRVRHGLACLRARFYHWRRSGRTPECLALRFSSKLPPVPTEIVRAFVDACAVAGVTHFSQAIRLTDSKGFSYHRVLVSLPDQVLLVIRRNFSARRQAKTEACKLVNQFQGRMRRLLTAEANRSRRLKKLAESFIGRRGRGRVDSTSRQLEAPVQATGAIFKRVLQEVTK